MVDNRIFFNRRVNFIFKWVRGLLMTNKQGTSDTEGQANEPEYDSTPEDIVMVTNDYKPKPGPGKTVLNETEKK